MKIICNEWLYSEMRTCYDKNIQSHAPYRYVITTQLNHLARLAKCLSVRLQTELSGCCSNLNFKYRASFEQGVL